MFDTIEMTAELRRKLAYEDRFYDIYRLKDGDEWIPCRVVSCRSVVQVTTINPMWKGGSKQMFMTPQVYSQISRKSVNDEERKSLMKWEQSRDPKTMMNVNIREF